MRLRLALLAAALLAACDAVTPAPPDPPDPPEPATITVARPLADTVVFEGSPRWVPLEERFRHSAGAPLSYAAHADGDALAVHVSPYDYLVLEPRALGAATVVVEARAEDGARAADTLTVEVLPACPPDPAPGARDYFPLEEGRTWHYAGTATTVYAAHTEHVTFEASVTLAAVACQAGERRVTLEVTYPWSPSATRTRAFDLTEQRDHTLRFKPTLLYSGEMLRYHVPAAPDTLEAAAFFEPAAAQLCYRYTSLSDVARRALFVVGVGPVHVWRQRAVSHSTYGQGVQTCRLDLVP